VNRDADDATVVLTGPSSTPRVNPVAAVADALTALYEAHNAPPESWDHDHVRACEAAYRTERAKLVL
jgi:hypothetical protein